MLSKKIIGNRGETAAANYLQNQGWQIMTRNHRLGSKEIDLIANKNNRISLFEIKTRRKNSACQLISEKQKAILRQAHLIFCEQNKLDAQLVDYGLIIINYDQETADLNYYLNFL